MDTAGFCLHNRVHVKAVFVTGDTYMNTGALVVFSHYHHLFFRCDNPEGLIVVSPLLFVARSKPVAYLIIARTTSCGQRRDMWHDEVLLF